VVSRSGELIGWDKALVQGRVGHDVGGEGPFREVKLDLGTEGRVGCGDIGELLSGEGKPGGWIGGLRRLESGRLHLAPKDEAHASVPVEVGERSGREEVRDDFLCGPDPAEVEGLGDRVEGCEDDADSTFLSAQSAGFDTIELHISQSKGRYRTSNLRVGHISTFPP
jgi:hypothetical protein